ncbi:hypothetical protein ACTMU2_29400 [Cupriavidus basilensis]
MNSCCHQHDHDYGTNGTKSRVQADRDLRECVRAGGGPGRSLRGLADVGGGARFRLVLLEEKTEPVATGVAG